eukprot:TRINITY_DN3998_c0_g1_i3.p2 TRINITY_DN3998_c0_g1~~TRINITY_DN3998_c0_g1_i3.p2  ORF type:complete len:120 (-),score=34.26 TRINITY_DN3998_c0_g1_i3:303-662(-)
MYGKGWGGWGWWGGKGWGKGKRNSNRRMLQVDPSLKVWVGDLPEGVTWKELETHMDTAAKSKWVELLGGKGKGTAIVVFSSAEDATTAISKLNNSVLKEKNIQVDTYVKAPKEEKEDAA